jgi:hypothetical protein
MEPDDLLCSRNARPQKALVGRAQWKINQPPSLGDITSDLGRTIFGRLLRPYPRNGVSMGREAVLADSGRAGEKSGFSEQPAIASERVCEHPGLAFRSCSGCL